eukprot:TRINITY_DN11056_c0_g1_i2.p1 TRINITY_DN11056_c0_g1~~TRINITY_DN11056_c0_g1_i2.p1  ORF type:complete len:224 (+),score=37.92 TRINITY_DN11056_c0_g1_i2:605-1276(+)
MPQASTAPIGCNTRLHVFWPVCSQFCGRTSEGWPMPSPQDCPHAANGNWDAVCMSAVASWAVFLDNTTMLKSVQKYFSTGAGNGRLTNYIIDPEGECQESGRDQAHVQLGLFNLVQAGLTLYHATNDTTVLTMENYRLRAGLEYTARYNLGYAVPYTSNCGPPGLPRPKGRGWCFQTISNASRGEFAPFWEMACAIFGQDQVPYVQQILSRKNYRPELSLIHI